MTHDSWNLSPDDALKRLQAAHGSAWMIWYVPCYDGHKSYIRWCARRHADRALLHSTQPHHLAEYVEAANAEAEALRVALCERDKQGHGRSPQ